MSNKLDKMMEVLQQLSAGKKIEMPRRSESGMWQMLLNHYGARIVREGEFVRLEDAG